MSIRHCIAGIVLVIVGCLAVNAYPDPPQGESTTADTRAPKAADTKAVQAKAVDKASDTEVLQARIKQLEERLAAERAALQEAKGQQAQLEKQHAGLERVLHATAEKPLPPRDREDTFTTAVWRFQFYPRQADQPPSERGMMVDTATGRCWSLSRRQPRWEDLGGPYEAAAERPAG